MAKSTTTTRWRCQTLSRHAEARRFLAREAPGWCARAHQCILSLLTGSIFARTKRVRSCGNSQILNLALRYSPLHLAARFERSLFSLSCAFLCAFRA
eukprot:1427706-Pleurochrysis_carterae.AAC.1